MASIPSKEQFHREDCAMMFFKKTELHLRHLEKKVSGLPVSFLDTFFATENFLQVASEQLQIAFRFSAQPGGQHILSSKFKWHISC